ncbi:hypothetical protein ACUXK4_004860 [Methylorubrum extorquens]
MLRKSLMLAQDVLQSFGDLVLLLARGIAWCGVKILDGSGWCGNRAREWEPRLWDRDEDPRSDAEERRP